MTRKKVRSAPTPTPVDAAGGFGAMEAGRAPLGQSPTGRDFKPDYTYVIRDLKRIVVLAGSLIVILLALSFFLK